MSDSDPGLKNLFLEFSSTLHWSGELVQVRMTPTEQARCTRSCFDAGTLPCWRAPYSDKDWPLTSPVNPCLDCSDHNNDEAGATEVFRELAKKQEPLGAEFEAAIGDQSTLYETDEPA